MKFRPVAAGNTSPSGTAFAVSRFVMANKFICSQSPVSRWHVIFPISLAFLPHCPNDKSSSTANLLSRLVALFHLMNCNCVSIRRQVVFRNWPRPIQQPTSCSICSRQRDKCTCSDRCGNAGHFLKSSRVPTSGPQKLCAFLRRPPTARLPPSGLRKLVAILTGSSRNSWRLPTLRENAPRWSR